MTSHRNHPPPEMETPAPEANRRAGAELLQQQTPNPTASIHAVQEHLAQDINQQHCLAFGRAHAVTELGRAWHGQKRTLRFDAALSLEDVKALSTTVELVLMRSIGALMNEFGRRRKRGEVGDDERVRIAEAVVSEADGRLAAMGVV